MSGRVWILTALLIATVLAASAAPALSEDSDRGTIVGTVKVPGAACIRVSSTSLDYGTHPFAANGQLSFAVSDPTTFTVTNCPAAPASIFRISGSHATGPGAMSWTLTDGWSECDGSLNRYGVPWIQRDPYYVGGWLTTTPMTLMHRRSPTADPVATFEPGESAELLAQLNMPCVGSDGAGQTFSFTVGLIAEVA